jgi:streptogramin lyase/cytochrome c5
MTIIRRAAVLASALAGLQAQAATINAVDVTGGPLATVMVTQSEAHPAARDLSDGGYQQPGKPIKAAVDISGFTDARGRLELANRPGAMRYRLRKTGYKDAVVMADGAQASLRVTMEIETDAFKLAEAKPANAWLGALKLPTVDGKKHFQMQCGFCHQQGSPMIRRERSAEEWHTTIDRMMRYGSRLPSDLQKTLPQQLSDGYRRLRENPSLLAAVPAWEPTLASVTITEWPIGDAMSQTHDMLMATNRLVYVADNIQDRLYEINPLTDAVAVYKIPHLPGDQPGGLISGRLKEFPRHDDTSNAHSLAQSQRDGHIFITPSAQRRLVEFDPVKKTFVLHEIGAGFYPHTIRIDAQDNVWFTLALSNQVARFDRASQKFTLYDLPTRGLREQLTVSFMHVLFKLIGWGVPLNNWLPVDTASTGTPLPYGIEVTPDGSIWFARLHTSEIGKIDPKTGAITMVKTPFIGPRRLRADAEGNLWIAAFAESSLARYVPATGKFTLFPLPVNPLGSETPYGLAVDKKRGIVWVNGNQSDALYGLDIRSQTWRTVPLPRRTSFTRDIDVDEDGTLYTANSNFPSWQIEDAQPTMIRVQFK